MSLVDDVAALVREREELRAQLATRPASSVAKVPEVRYEREPDGWSVYVGGRHLYRFSERHAEYQATTIAAGLRSILREHWPPPASASASEGEVERLRGERDALREDLRRVADALGYVNYADGSGGYEVAPTDKLVEEVHRLTRERDEARAEVERLTLENQRLIRADREARAEADTMRGEVRAANVGKERLREEADMRAVALARQLSALDARIASAVERAVSRVLDECGVACADVEAIAHDKSAKEAARECLRRIASIREHTLGADRDHPRNSSNYFPGESPGGDLRKIIKIPNAEPGGEGGDSSRANDGCQGERRSGLTPETSGSAPSGGIPSQSDGSASTANPGTPPSPASAAGERHDYTSTACGHGLHARCRQTCKFCNAKCGCECHPFNRTGRAPAAPAPLSDEAKRAREPLPVEEMIGALHDRVHVETGKLVAATPLRAPAATPAEQGEDAWRDVEVTGGDAVRLSALGVTLDLADCPNRARALASELRQALLALVTAERARARRELEDMVVTLIESRRQRVIADKTDPSWTEHFAELQNEVRALGSRAGGGV